MNGYWRVVVFMKGQAPFGMLMTKSEYEAKGGFQWGMNNLPDDAVVVLFNPLGRVSDQEFLSTSDIESEIGEVAAVA
jgi:hypothetical protein